MAASDAVRAVLFAAVTALIMVSQNPVAAQKVFACYFSNWAGYRPGNGRFEPEDIDVNECTHLMYAFGNINANLLQFQPSDSWADLSEGGGKGYYRRFNKLKEDNPNLKTLLSLGGQADDPRGLWDAVADPGKRKQIIDNGIGYLGVHGFDGVDLFWLLPSTGGGSYQQRTNMGVFIAELVEAFRAADLIVTASIPATIPPEYERADDFHALFAEGAMDFVSVQTMDFHGAWETHTHHSSPLYKHYFDDFYLVVANMNHSMTEWLSKSEADPSLLLATIPTYGRGFTLLKSAENDFYDEAFQPGISGPYTQTSGFMGYLEICEMQEKYADSYTEIFEDSVQASYAVFNDFQWWGYETPASASLKAEYVVDNDFGGVALYTLELDDTHNTCGTGRNSIGNTVKAVLDAAGK